MNIPDFLPLVGSPTDIPVLVLLLGLTFVFVPGVVFHLGVRIFFPHDHPRQRELIAEWNEVPHLQKPFWVLSVILMFATEGVPAWFEHLRAAPRDDDEPTAEDELPATEPVEKSDGDAEQLNRGPAEEPRVTATGFADTDWFTPVEAGAAAGTAILDEDFRAWRAEFPDFFSLPDADESAYSGTLAITDHDVRVALGPQADELMAAADVDIDELIRLINAETTVLPVIPKEPSADWLRAYGISDDKLPPQGRHRKR